MAGAASGGDDGPGLPGLATWSRGRAEHRVTGWKVDIIVRKPDRFARVEFERRIQAEVLGVHVCVATAEGTVLSKLVWANASGGSERQLRDVAGIVAAAPSSSGGLARLISGSARRPSRGG